MLEREALPKDFDGVFRFTNFTERDFKAKWAGIEYTFPAMKTTPMIIPGQTPEEIQYIRKKFARELSEQEFYKTPKFVGMNNVQPGGTPALYTDSDLTPFVQKCLEPLPVAQMKAAVMPKRITEEVMSKDSKGRKVTKVVEQGDSLLQEGSAAIE